MPNRIRNVLPGIVLLSLGWTLPACANQAALNSDGVLVIAGVKVFPIGFTTSPPPESQAPSGQNAIQELAEAGATFLRAGPLAEPWTEQRFEAEQRMEAAAAKYGMHCWLNLREAAAAKTPQSEALLRRIITTFRDHPGLGCYKGEDEPEWGKAKLEPLQRAYDLVRELDPHHPVVLIQAPRGEMENLRRYNAVGDIVGFDIYPIGYPPGANSQFVATNHEISMVGDYTRRAVELAAGRKGVWMTLQIAWSGVVKPGKTLRFPTFPEERFMAYQAIINGARGLMFFGGALPGALAPADRARGWNWRFWNRVLRPVVEEIGSRSPLYPALLAPESGIPIRVQGGGVEFCVREVGSEIFLLACKRDSTTELVHFSGLPVARGAAEVLFEEPRVADVKDGTLSDWFGPFEVHVYRMRRAP